MVDSISSFNPLAYLNQIKGITPVAPASASTTDSSSSAASSTTPASASTTPPASSTPSNILGLSPDVLSLLQGSDSSSANDNLISSLLNSGSSSSSNGLIPNLFQGNNASSDPLSGLYATLLAQDSSTLPTQEAVAATQAQQTQASENSNPIQNVLNSYTSGLNAYNQTLLQNAQSVLKANSVPLTA